MSHGLQRLHDAGVSIWLDTLSRDLLESGEFARLVGSYSVTGATSNPNDIRQSDHRIRPVTTTNCASRLTLVYASRAICSSSWP